MVSRRTITIIKTSLPLFKEHDILTELCSLEVRPANWRMTIIDYLKNLSLTTNSKTMYHAIRYLVLGDHRYKKGTYDLLLKYLIKLRH